MGLSMLLKIGSCSESLSAFRTLERLFTSVDFLVSFKVWNLSKGLVAVRMRTLVRFLSGVNSKVFLQGRVLGERLSTSDGWAYKLGVLCSFHFMFPDMWDYLILVFNDFSTWSVWTDFDESVVICDLFVVVDLCLHCFLVVCCLNYFIH